MHLGVVEFIDLSIGPRWDTPIPFDRYHALYHEWAHLFDTSSWAYQFFETGADARAPMELDPNEPVGLPGA
jgi:hypothetical protein